MRGNKYSLAALAAAGIVLAQLVGCSSCVKDEPAVDPPGARTKPIPLSAANKQPHQFADASTD